MPDTPTAWRLHGVQWSPDGASLAVLTGRGFSVLEVPDGRIRFAVTNAPESYLSWSPVDPLIVFNGNHCVLEEWQPMLIQADGSQLRPLARQPLGWSPWAMTWTPDGSRVVMGWRALVEIGVDDGAVRTILGGFALALNVTFVAPDVLVAFGGWGGGACEGETDASRSVVVFPEVSD